VARSTRISVMLAVPSANTAADWYQRALGATQLWNLGGVVGLEIEGAPFFLHEPTGAGFASPATLGATTVRVEVFSDDPDAFIGRAVAAGRTAHSMRSRTIRRLGAFTGREDSPTRSVMSGSLGIRLR
jgi:PhnB protein